MVVRVQDERSRADLQYLRVGKGKYFTFFRPCHMVGYDYVVSIEHEDALMSTDEALVKAVATLFGMMSRSPIPLSPTWW